ncbi:MAG: hypothetical protein P4L99_28625 [Chthoniobacter sp.]|nr:hypothetical protein [Chthoniobacter sp.]
MFAKTSLILTLVLSLLFVTQAQTVVVPVEMKQGGGCAAMQCGAGCCANVVCCKVTEQQKAPQTPVPASPDNQAQVQLAALDWRAYTILFLPPVPRRPFVVSDEASTAHTLPPLAVSCIQLI